MSIKADRRSELLLGGGVRKEHSVDLQSVFERAHAAALSGEAAEAERLYRVVIDADPDQLEARRFFAALLGQEGRYTDAREVLAYALACEPWHAGSHVAMGIFCDREGLAEKAGYHLGRAV